MRRTNTDYKFSEETPNLHYLSTLSLKSNDNNENTQSNLEFNYYFNHLCHNIDDNIDICHKTTLGNTYESGIGSSISSIDVHCNLSVTSEESCAHVLELEHLSPGLTCNNSVYSHFDYHDLPPVTEEEDNDSIFGIFNVVTKENKHLNALPWHGQCCECVTQSYKYKKPAFTAIDTKKTSCLLTTNQWWEYFPLDNSEMSDITPPPVVGNDDHIERPWIMSTANVNSFVPVLSSVCHKSADCLLKSESFLTHQTNTNMISNKAMMYKVFQRRHSGKNDSSMFTYNIRSLIAMDDSSENDNFDDDNEEYIQGSLSD